MESEINATSLIFTLQPCPTVEKITVEAQKIDCATLKIYRLIVSTFEILDRDNMERIFGESFLLANFKPDIVLGIPFLMRSNVNIDLQARNLQ